MLTYTIAKPYLKDENMSAYEFMPLEGDPTPEEKRQMDQERLERESQQAAADRKRILNKFKQRNGGL